MQKDPIETVKSSTTTALKKIEDAEKKLKLKKKQLLKKANEQNNKYKDTVLTYIKKSKLHEFTLAQWMASKDAIRELLQKTKP